MTIRLSVALNFFHARPGRLFGASTAMQVQSFRAESKTGDCASTVTQRSAVNWRCGREREASTAMPTRLLLLPYRDLVRQERYSVLFDVNGGAGMLW
jgi:predicted component of type VI protein secretion system